MNKKRSFQSYEHISRHDDRDQFCNASSKTSTSTSKSYSNLWNYNLDPIVSRSNNNNNQSKQPQNFNVNINQLHGQKFKSVKICNGKISSYFPEQFIIDLDKQGYFLTYNNDMLYAIQCTPDNLSVSVCHPNHFQTKIIPKSAGNQLQKNGDFIWTPSLTQRIYFQFIPTPKKKIIATTTGQEDYTV